MYEKKMYIRNNIGLHSKVSANFAKKAKEFKSFIWLSKEENSINAKNLLEILSLGIINGDMIKISADGVDEEQAVETLVEFLSKIKI